MAITIGSNIASLRAQRQLADATDKVSYISERLSSGMRINHASDDAAGLAIVESLNTQQRLYTSAIRNINDGVSALTIAASALESQNDILTRMSELAEQSANGSLSSVQRSTLQNEYTQLRREFGRIAAVTSFNGIFTLHGSKRGSLDSLSIQAGINGSTNSQLRITLGDSGSFSGVLDRTSLNFISSDISGTTFSESTIESTFGSGVFKVNDDLIVTAFEDGSFGTIGIFTWQRNSDGTWTNTQSMDLTYNTQTGEIDSSSDSFKAILAQGVDLRALKISDSTGQYGPNIGQGNNIEFSSILTQDNARKALDTISRRQQALSSLRGQLGTGQSRLGVAASVNQTTRLELGSAESRIRDIDVASESANLIAMQIRQQIATQVLRQANLLPQLVNQLLRED